MDFDDDFLADPFQDPFAKPRSGSPDPWSSFSHQPQPSTNSHDPYEDPYKFSYNEGRSTTPTTGSYATGEPGESPPNSTADPLEAATVNAKEEEELYHTPAAAASPRTPGFRESISEPKPDPEEHIKTVSEPEPATPPANKTPPKILSPTAAARTEARDRSPSSSYSHEQKVSSASTPHSLKARSPIVSPLEQPSGQSTLDRPFASLALGGESVGGWQADRGSWVNERPVASSSNISTDDDDDDDVPILQAKANANEASNKVLSLNRNDKGIQPVFTITVDDPQKVGDPIRSFTMYTVHTRTTSPLYQKSSFSVLRRYSDFLWLYETLSLNNPGVVVPPAPEKNPFGRFNTNFVQQRRQALEKCIQKTANHPILCKDLDLKMFLESDTFALDIKHRKAEIAHERGGLMASIGQAVVGPRFYETDEWFDQQKVYLDSLEAQLRGLVKAIDLVAKQRTEMATATGEFAQAISDLSSSDVGKQLAHSLAAMADVERKAQELQVNQSSHDVISLMSTVDEYTRLINSVRLAFNSRIRTYHAWQAADAEVRKVKQNHERARGQGRIPTERLGHSLSVIAETERRASESKQEYEHCSKLIKTEVARFEQERIEDFKDSLQVFLEEMISRQKELIATWENYQQLLLKRVGGQTAGGHAK